LVSACSDLGLPSHELSTLADLLVLLQQANAPEPQSKSFWVSNTRQSVQRINHPDAYNTLYLELTFPAHSLSSLNGIAVGEADSVYVTIDPRPGSYGITISPAGISFDAGARPTATFSFSVYGDASAASLSARYDNSADFVAALDIWRETAVDQWEVVPGSGASGTDAVRGSVESSGSFLVAAPR